MAGVELVLALPSDRNTCRLVQEPYPSFAVVDPALEEARCSDVVIFVTDSVSRPHISNELLVVASEFGRHVRWRHEVRIVVQNSPEPTNAPNRTQRRATDFARPLGNGICHRKDLLALLVKHQVVTAKVRSR